MLLDSVYLSLRFSSTESGQVQMGHAQWIGHILNRLALTDRSHKKAYTGGQMYLIDRTEVSDMMRRYDVAAVSGANSIDSPEN